MSRKLRYGAIVAVLAIVAAACGGDSTSGDTTGATGDTGAEPVAGGTLRVGFDGGRTSSTA